MKIKTFLFTVLIIIPSVLLAGPTPPPAVGQHGAVTAGHIAIWFGNKSIQDGGATPQVIITCGGTDDTALFSGLTTGNYYIGSTGGVCKTTAISWTGVSFTMTFAPDTTLKPVSKIDKLWTATSSTIVINNITIDGDGLIQTALSCNTTSSCWFFRPTITNVGYPSDAATGIVRGIDLSDETYASIQNATFSNFHSVGNGTCGDALGSARHIYLHNSGWIFVSNVNSSGGDDTEDNDYFHSEQGNTGGAIFGYKARYNQFTRRVFKFQSGDFNVYGADVRPGTDFTPVPGQQVGLYNLNMIDKAGSFSGEVNIIGGTFDASGFSFGIVNSISTLGSLYADGITLIGPTMAATRSATPPCGTALTAFDTVGFSLFSGSINGGISNSLIKNFGRSIVNQGSNNYATNNKLDDPLSFAAEIGSSTQKTANNFTGNTVTTRTSGNLNLSRIVRVFNVLNAKVDDNYLNEAGNTTHANRFIDFTDASATGEAFHNLSENLTTTTTPVNIVAGGAVKIQMNNSLNSGWSFTLAPMNSVTATFASIPSLSANVISGATYHFTIQLFVDANITGGHQYDLNGGTATVSAIASQVKSVCNATNLFVITSRQTTLAGAIGQAGCTAAETNIEGDFTASSTGTFIPRFAQNTASGTSSVIAGSSMVVTQLNN